MNSTHIGKLSEGTIEMKEVRKSLNINLAGRREHLFFNFIEFCFFSHSERECMLFFGSARAMHPFVIVPYILMAEVIFFRGWRYFVKLKGQVVGILAVHERMEALFINSLAVSPECRRLGIATHILIYAEELAMRLRRKRLELSVLKRNIPAQKLYKRFGFAKKEEKMWSFVLSKEV